MEKILKPFPEHVFSGNKGYRKADPEGKRSEHGNKAQDKNSGADSDYNELFFDFVTVFSTVAGAGMTMVVVAASAVVIVAVLIMA